MSLTDKVKSAVFLGVVIVTICFVSWIYTSLERLHELEKIVATQQAAIEQKDAALAAERANNATLRSIAEHKEMFEKQLASFMTRTSKQLKEVLANDKEAKDWWSSTIPTTVLQLQCSESSNGSSDSKVVTSAR